MPARFSSASRTFKWLFVLLCLALAAFYFDVISKDYRAAELANSDPAQLARALELAPGRADYHHRYGRQLFMVRQDARGAVQEYRRAVELNPRSAAAWLDLALAHQALGQKSQQNHALQRALAVDSHTPNVAWWAGQQYVAGEQIETGLQQLRVVIEYDPLSSAAALDLAWEATHDPALMLRSAIPPNAHGRLTFLNYLVEHQQPEGAALAWTEVTQLNQKFAPALALPYVEFLLSEKWANPAAAVEVWKTLQIMDAEFPAFKDGSLIVNGSFEQPALNGGLDWRSEPATGVNAAIDVNHAYSGSRSLAIVLDGAAVGELGIFQYLALRPNTRYQFSAYVRDESLVGAGGLRFEISNRQSGAVYYRSMQLPETDTWQLVRGSFQTPKESGVAVLKLTRTPVGQPFRGRFWIDGVELASQ